MTDVIKEITNTETVNNDKQTIDIEDKYYEIVNDDKIIIDTKITSNDTVNNDKPTVNTEIVNDANTDIILKNNECNFIELFSRNGFLSFKVYDYYVNSFEQNYYLRCGYKVNYKPKYPNLKINIETYGCPNTWSWYPFIGKEHDDIKWENYDDYNVILSHENDDDLNKIQMFEKVINSSKFNCKNILLFSIQLNFNLDISKKYNACYKEDLKLANSGKYGTYIIYNKID